MSSCVQEKKTSKLDCTGCPATCCHNLSMSIGKPANKAEIEDLKWQLHFNTVKVYIRKRRWYQWVEGRCIYLDENHLCKIYDTRPDKCRNHNPPDCELFGKFYDIMFETPEQLEEYFKKSKKR